MPFGGIRRERSLFLATCRTRTASHFTASWFGDKLTRMVPLIQTVSEQLRCSLGTLVAEVPNSADRHCVLPSYLGETKKDAIPVKP